MRRIRAQASLCGKEGFLAMGSSGVEQVLGVVRVRRCVPIIHGATIVPDLLSSWSEEGP